MNKRTFANTLQIFFQASICSLSLIFISCDSGSSDSSSSTSSTSSNNTTSTTTGNEEEPNEATIIETSRFVDPLLQPVLDSFVQELRNRQISADLSNITMVLVDDFGPSFTGLSQGGSTAGLCFRSSGLIQIDRFFMTNPGFLLEIIYHELGHCVLGMEHRPNSIMSPTLPRATPSLIDELFTEAFFFELGVLSSPGELEEGHEVMLIL